MAVPATPEAAIGGVVSVIPKGLKLAGETDWRNFSRFAADIVPPMRGQTVTLTLDLPDFVRAVQATSGPQKPVAGRQGALHAGHAAGLRHHPVGRPEGGGRVRGGPTAAQERRRAQDRCLVGAVGEPPGECRRDRRCFLTPSERAACSSFSTHIHGGIGPERASFTSRTGAVPAPKFVPGCRDYGLSFVSFVAIVVAQSYAGVERLEIRRRIHGPEVNGDGRRERDDPAGAR